MQYEVAMHPRFVAQSQVPLPTALLEALESHRYVLRLDHDNTDALFNTGELLTEIAERIAEDDQQVGSVALPLLEEALGILQQCLSLQETQYLRFQETLGRGAHPEDSSQGPTSQDCEDRLSSAIVNDTSEEEQWALVVEPITKDTLIDTVLAQLGTLTSLCNILTSEEGISQHQTLRRIEEISAHLLSDKLPAYEDGKNQRSNVTLRIAQFKSAFLEASFRARIMDIKTYKCELDAVFVSAGLDQGSYSVLMTHADCLITFVSAINGNARNDLSSVAAIEWDALSAAIASLTKAGKVRDLFPNDAAETHSKRGDLSLLQYQLGKSLTSFAVAAQNVTLSLENARVYYRNATNLTTDEAKRRIHGQKQLLVGALQGENLSISIGEETLTMIALNESIVNMEESGLLADQDVNLIRRRLASVTN